MVPFTAVIVAAIFGCAMGSVVLISIGRAASLADYSIPHRTSPRR